MLRRLSYFFIALAAYLTNDWAQSLFAKYASDRFTIACFGVLILIGALVVEKRRRATLEFSGPIYRWFSFPGVVIATVALNLIIPYLLYIQFWTNVQGFNWTQVEIAPNKISVEFPGAPVRSWQKSGDIYGGSEEISWIRSYQSGKIKFGLVEISYPDWYLVAHNSQTILSILEQEYLAQFNATRGKKSHIYIGPMVGSRISGVSRIFKTEVHLQILVGGHKAYVLYALVPRRQGSYYLEQTDRFFKSFSVETGVQP